MKKSSPGFTLMELLVVIAIIAVLATIGLVSYWNIQKKARDSRRMADLYSISTMMEVGYNNSNNSTYSPLSLSMFTNGIPQDPLDGGLCQGNPCKYCVRDAYGGCEPSDQTIAVGMPPGGPSYLVCANLELGDPAYFCRKSQR